MSLKSVKTLTASEIAKKWKLSQKTVNSLIDDGAKVEHEHDKDMKNAKQIARDHISERPDYYKKLSKMEKTKIKLNELGEYDNKGGSRVVGDLTGSSRKVMKVDEVKLPKVPEKVKTKAKKAVAVGMTAANLATGADIYDRASRGVGSPIRDVAAAASGLPGKVGYAAMGANWTVKGFDKAKEHIRTRQRSKMEEQGSPANPARYTERPMYERRHSNELPSGEVERGIYEDDAMKNAEDKIKAAFAADKVKGMFKRVDKQRDKDPKWVAYKKRKQMKEEVSDSQVDRYLKGIGGTESGGTKDPYKARSKRSSAEGKYQYIGSTWRNVVRQYGGQGDTKKYPTASSAPPDYQEKIARSDARGAIEKYGERGAVLRHFTGNPAGKMSPKAQRANPGVTADTYYKRFQKFAGDVIGIKSASASDKPATSTAPKPEITNKPPETPKTPELAKAPETPKTPETTSKNFGVSLASNDVAKKMSAPQTPDTSSSNYTVRKGDTLSDIAKSHHTDIDTIAKASHISDPNKIYPGQKIKFDEDAINEISAELVGKVSNARFWQGKAPSKTLSRAINKKFIESGKKDKGKVNKDKKDIKEELMDTKELIHEAIGNIMEENLHEMKDNFLAVLQEKAAEKLEERKKEIAANYFGQ